MNSVYFVSKYFSLSKKHWFIRLIVKGYLQQIKNTNNRKIFTNSALKFISTIQKINKHTDHSLLNHRLSIVNFCFAK